MSARLTDSPSCLVLDEYDMAPHLPRLLREAGQDRARQPHRPWRSIRTTHCSSASTAKATRRRASDLAALLLEQAEIAAGAPLPDPAAFVQRMNRVLLGA